MNKTDNAVLTRANPIAVGSEKLEPRGVAVLLRCGSLLATLFCLGILLHSPSLAARSEGPRVFPGLTGGANFAIADFDGDRLPDVATVESGPSEASRTRYWIHFAFGRGSRTGVAISGPVGGLQIASRDVNGDSFLDLIVSTELANVPVAVLLNDGAGNFALADAQGFAAAIWDARQEWQAVGGEDLNDCAAMVGSGWAGWMAISHGGVKARPARTRISIPCEKLRCFVVLLEVQGRAPPSA